MDGMLSAEVWSTLVGAIVGGIAAVYAARWSIRQVAREERQERLGDEIANLRAAGIEIGVASEIAEAASATPLPMALLVAAMPSIHHMNDQQREALITYTQQALRYNARVTRLIAYGQGKRADGQTPGAEKPLKQAERVLSAVQPAAAAIAAHLGSERYRQSSQRRGVSSS
jgi:hypothetical protein